MICECWLGCNGGCWKRCISRGWGDCWRRCENGVKVGVAVGIAVEVAVGGGMVGEGSGVLVVVGIVIRGSSFCTTEFVNALVRESWFIGKDSELIDGMIVEVLIDGIPPTCSVSSIILLVLFDSVALPA